MQKSDYSFTNSIFTSPLLPDTFSVFSPPSLWSGRLLSPFFISDEIEKSSQLPVTVPLISPFLTVKNSVIYHKTADRRSIGLLFFPPVHKKANQYIVAVNCVGVHLWMILCFRDGDRVAAGAPLSCCANTVLAGCQSAHFQDILRVNCFYPNHSRDCRVGQPPIPMGLHK